ncbi:MAG: magnesium and cobalt transport protein CorA [Pseudomonadota bacterium]
MNGGDRASLSPAARWRLYGEDGIHSLEGPDDAPAFDPAQEATRSGGFLWGELVRPDAAAMAALQVRFGLHELIIEDMLSAGQRPKLEAYGDGLFLVLRPAITHQGSLRLGELHAWISPHLALIVHHSAEQAALPLRRSFEHAPRALGRGAVNALHALLDAVVDGYLPWIEHLDARLARFEERIVRGAAPRHTREEGGPEAHEVLAQLYGMRREMLRLRTAVLPVERMIHQLEHLHPDFAPPKARVYLRDVQDHALQVLSQLEALHELQVGVAQLQLSLASHEQNIVVRKLAGWAAILALPTMVFSLYGMNFRHMPELDWYWGYPFTLAATSVGSYLLYRYLRRIRWL